METARALASAGATVVLGNRSGAKADAAAADLRASVPGVVELQALDLASLASVRDFASRVGNQHDELHVLINNAGVMATPLTRTVEGFELQFGTNHLGHFLLTNLLMPLLIAGAPSRVVNVSSHGHRVSGGSIGTTPTTTLGSTSRGRRTGNRRRRTSCSRWSSSVASAIEACTRTQCIQARSPRISPAA